MSRDAIIDQVDQATDPQELMKIIQSLPNFPINQLQTVVKDYIRNLSDNSIKTIYYHMTPIDEILPTDVMQEILSFNLYQHHLLSKNFKRLSERSQAKKLKQRNEIIENTTFNIDFQTGTRWIVCVDPQRPQLNQDEIPSGCKGPVTLHDALEQCKIGDVLLLCDGEHTLIPPGTLRNPCDLFRCSVSFIGIGKRVVVNLPVEDYTVSFVSQKVYFKNIHLKQIDIGDGSLSLAIADNGHLWIEQCTIEKLGIQFESLHRLHTDSCINRSLHIKNCDINLRNNGTVPICINVDIVPRIVEIVGCTFTGCGFLDVVNKDDWGCIKLYYDRYRDNTHLPSVTIAGNIFSDNPGRSIVFGSHNKSSRELRQRYDSFMNAVLRCNTVTIQHNIFQKRNGTVWQQIPPFETPNPDKIYLTISGN
eukprot:210414_1